MEQNSLIPTSKQHRQDTQAQPTRRPTLLLGWIPRIVSTIAHSLNRQGIPVDVANFSSRPRCFSRSIRHSVLLPDPETSATEFVKALRALINEHEHDMLIPTDDQALAVLGRHRDNLDDLLHVACPPRDVLDRVLNKASTLEVAQVCGIPVPRSVSVTSLGELSEALCHFSFPVVLKPLTKCRQEDELKACILSHLGDLPKYVSTDRELRSPLLVQEFCDGVGVGIEMLIHKRECVARFQHRRLLELPYRGGYAVTAVADPPDPGLVRMALKLLRALDWEGVAMVEFRVNRNDGRAVLMEVNGRYWGSMGLPVAAAIDFPLFHWQLVHGEQPPIPDSYPLGVKWRWTVGYIARLHGVLAAAIHSSKARGELKQTIRGLGSDFSPSVHDAMFRMSDPMPAIDELS